MDLRKVDIKHLQLSVKGKVVISFLTAVACVFFAWVVMNTVFKETLKTVDRLSQPDQRQLLINRIFRSISEMNQLQYVQYDIAGNHGKKDRFKHATQKLMGQLDSLSMFDPANLVQQKRIDSMKVLINEHRKVYVNYSRLKSDIVKSTSLSKRIRRLRNLVYESSLQLDSSIKTSQQKITTTIEPEEVGQKTQQGGFWNKLFGRKPKNETILKKTITEEYNLKIDTLSLSQQDSLMKAIEQYINRMTMEHQRKGLRFIEKERDLLASSNHIVNKLFLLIASIKDDDGALALQQSVKTANTIHTGMFRLNLIVFLFFGCLGVLSLLIVFDITRSNEYRRALQVSKDEAERLTEVKQRFLSNMSHEIRTPLQSILGFAEQARKKGKAERDTVEAIFNSSGHLLQIVNEILDYNRLHSGKIALIHKPFSLHKLVHEVGRVMNVHALSKKLVLRIDQSGEEDVICMGDEFRLMQILYNLIGNAIKFTEQGGVKVTVSKHIVQDHVDVTFIIEDSGIGMTAEQLAHVFDEFEQANAHIAVNYGGTGLGLAIVKELVELMGGMITVSSEPEKGTVFTLSVQLKISDKKEQYMADSGSDMSLKLRSQPVWLADDDLYIRKVCALIFESNQVPYRAFASATELLNALPAGKRPVFLLDIRMPGTNGIQLCRLIKEKDPQTVVIALTAQALPDEHESILLNGFDAILTKPFTEAQLLGLLGSVKHSHSCETSYNLDRMMRFAQGDSFILAENIQLLIRESLNDLKLMDDYLIQKNASGLADVLHRLSGRIGLTGASAVSKELQRLEYILRATGNSNAEKESIKQAMENVSILLSQLKQEVI